MRRRQRAEARTILDPEECIIVPEDVLRRKRLERQKARAEAAACQRDANTLTIEKEPA